MLKNYVTEFIGTFFLALTVCLTVASGTTFAPLAIGSSLMIMVYMGGPISGGHFNPAVSLAVFLRGKLAGKDLGAYMIMQVLGAFVAALIVHYLTGQGRSRPIPSMDIVWKQSRSSASSSSPSRSRSSCSTPRRRARARAIRTSASRSASRSWWAPSPSAGSPGGAFNPAIGTGPALARYRLRRHVARRTSGSISSVPSSAAPPRRYVFKFQNPGD